MRTLIFILPLLLFLSAFSQKNPTHIKKGKVAASKNYIPGDLDDCLKYLDSIFVDSNKTKIKTLTEEEFSGMYHHGFGTWMRNNWGFWKASRLSKYFNSLGIFHPDDMTGIIFISYHRKLTGREIKLDEQIRFYQNYWEKIKHADMERKKTEFGEYEIGDTVVYNYKNGFVSKSQENKYDNNECRVKGIIIDKEDDKVNIKVKLLEDCDKKGIICYDNKGSLLLNKRRNKMEKPKKRVIVYMKAGEEMWFNYADWEAND